LENKNRPREGRWGEGQQDGGRKRKRERKAGRDTQRAGGKTQGSR